MLKSEVLASMSPKKLSKIKIKFESKVLYTSPCGCHYWLGSLIKGYGRVEINSHLIKTHRLSYFLYKGVPPPDDLLVCHSCDNPSCVNPDHLFLGTNHDNMLDKVKKGRWKGGEPRKTTDSEIIEMRRLHASGVKIMDISKIFGYSKNHVGKIINLKRYTNVK